MYVNSQCVERVVFAVDGSCLFCYRVLFQFVARLRYAFFCRRRECHPLPRRCLYVPLCGVDLERLWWPAGGSGQPPAGEYIQCGTGSRGVWPCRGAELARRGAVTLTMTIQVTQLRLNSNPKFANLTQLRLNSKPKFTNLTHDSSHFT